MQLTASDFYTYYRPSECELRVCLRERGEEEEPLSPYQEVLRRLAERHERTHLATLHEVADLSGGALAERERRTREAVKSGTPAIYQGVLTAKAVLDGEECGLIGAPDFLIKSGGGYIVRDSKISRRITEKDHPEIFRQLEFYGWLYHQVFGEAALLLQVHRGAGDLVDIPYEGGAAALELLREIRRLKIVTSEPYSPVGWTKCGGCGFHGRCWGQAERRHDVALVAGLDQSLARALHKEGIATVERLLSGFDESRLAEFRRPWGNGTQRVGQRAGAILRNARALFSQEEVVLQSPEIPGCANYVMFDLEGLPPQFDELEKVYLWGLGVYGDRRGPYQGVIGGFGTNGDREGWEAFLSVAQAIFTEYGDLPFVHWAPYERVRVGMYVDRFGDRDGIAGRVRANLLDLLPITQKAVVLPLPSYSLKVVEKYIGFRRTLEEADGDWAMAKYIEATETENIEQRRSLMERIRTYNEEDLEATWAVLTWLKAKAG
jgi:predicted RecB family nuclease